MHMGLYIYTYWPIHIYIWAYTYWPIHIYIWAYTYRYLYTYVRGIDTNNENVGTYIHMLFSVFS
jgi:hypothetical protein